MDPSSVCSICSKSPSKVCTCTNTPFCDKHLAKHLKSEGNHRIASPEEVKVAIASRSSSLKDKKPATGEGRRRTNSARDRKRGRKSGNEDENPPVAEKKPLTKADFIAILRDELNKVARFRETTTDAIATIAESLILHVVVESKRMSREIVRMCDELEVPLREAMGILETLQESEETIPKTNRVLARLYDARDEPGYEMLRLHADIRELSLDFRTVAHYSAQWTPVAAMVQLQQYYDQHKASMHANVQSLYDTILAEQHYTVETITLSKSGLGERGNAEHLAQVLKYYSQVKELKLGGNELTGEDCRTLFPEIRMMKGVTKLYLQKNDLKASGGRELSFILSDLVKLRDLDLSSNSLGAEGLRHIAGVLKKLPNLKLLHLQDNSLGNESAKNLAAALKQVKTLKGLHLEGNSFSSEDIRMLNNSNASGCKIFFNKSS